MKNEPIKQGMEMVGKWLFEITNTVTGEKRQIEEYNLIPTVAKTAFAAQMSGQNSTDIGDNLYVAIGSNTTAPAAGDTQLGTETTRKASSSRSFSGAVGSVATFFAAGEATGTHKEFGLFGNGNAETASASANTGILFSHVAVNITVSVLETLTATFQITFSS